jgi:hypothetical protein
MSFEQLTDEIRSALTEKNIERKDSSFNTFVLGRRYDEVESATASMEGLTLGLRLQEMGRLSIAENQSGWLDALQNIDDRATRDGLMGELTRTRINTHKVTIRGRKMPQRVKRIIRKGIYRIFGWYIKAIIARQNKYNRAVKEMFTLQSSMIMRQARMIDYLVSRVERRTE